MNPLPHIAFPKDVEMTFRILGLFSLLFFASVFTFELLGNGELKWRGGGNQGGDLIQHYAGGQLWQKGDLSTLYQDFKLGTWINEHFVSGKFRLTHFNYVYPPIIALISSKLVIFSYTSWFYSWLIASIIIYLWAILFLLRNKVPLSLLLVLLGFPTFYYTLIPSQNVILSLAILIFSASQINQGKEFLGGIILSCLFYKPQILPYLVLFLFIIGHWRIVAGVVTGVAAWAVASLMLCGIESHLLWFESLRQMATGNQFIKGGHDQSWSSLLGYFLPQCSYTTLKVLSQILGSTLLISGAIFTRHIKIPVMAGDKIYLGITLWLLASPYVGFYEPLLAIAWWIWIVLYTEWSFFKKILVGLFWVASLLTISGLPSTSNLIFTAPLLTLWTAGTLFLLIFPQKPSFSQSSASL